MKLTYNNPDHAKELNPLSVQEVEQAVAFLNHAIEYGNMSHATISIFQKLITNYELYEHFHTVVGGWDGLNKTDTTIRECEGIPYINTNGRNVKYISAYPPKEATGIPVVRKAECPECNSRNIHTVSIPEPLNLISIDCLNCGNTKSYINEIQ